MGLVRVMQPHYPTSCGKVQDVRGQIDSDAAVKRLHWLHKNMSTQRLCPQQNSNDSSKNRYECTAGKANNIESPGGVRTGACERISCEASPCRHLCTSLMDHLDSKMRESKQQSASHPKYGKHHVNLFKTFVIAKNS